MSTWISKKATVYGDVIFGEDCSVFYNTVIRNEYDRFTFGKFTNIQDNCVIHTDINYPVTVGDYVTIGHGCILHGCQIGSNTVIGMGSIVMNGAKIGNNCIIGAGSLVTENTVIPDNCVAFGRPAKAVRAITEGEIRFNTGSALHYAEIKEDHRKWEEENM